MIASFKNKWVRFQYKNTPSITNRRVLLFKPVSVFFVLLLPIFLYLNESAGLKSISGVVLLLQNLAIAIILLVDLISDIRKEIFNITTLLYFFIFAFLFYYVVLELIAILL